MAAVHTPAEQITCIACGEVDAPAFSLNKDSTIGPSCQRCGAEQGIAIVGGQARGMTENGKQIREQREITGAAAPGMTNVLPLTRRPATPGRPTPRTAPAPPPVAAPAPDEWAGDDGAQRTPESVIDARINAARLELARLQVDQCRMLGLEAEVKALEKQRAKLDRVVRPLLT